MRIALASFLMNPQDGRGRILVSRAFSSRVERNANHVDTSDYMRQIQLFGPCARASSKERRAMFAGTFIVQNQQPNRAQRQAMRAALKKDRRRK